MNRKIYKLHEAYNKHCFLPTVCNFEGGGVYYCSCGAFTESGPDDNVKLKEVEDFYEDSDIKTTKNTLRETLGVITPAFEPAFRSYVKMLFPGWVFTADRGGGGNDPKAARTYKAWAKRNKIKLLRSPDEHPGSQ